MNSKINDPLIKELKEVSQGIMDMLVYRTNVCLALEVWHRMRGGDCRVKMLGYTTDQYIHAKCKRRFQRKIRTNKNANYAFATRC